MARVRQRGTAAELCVASILRELRASYRVNVRSLPGSPDFANKRRRWAIFVHGCFWHHHMSCKRATVPKHNRTFWLEKFSANRARDARAEREIKDAGFRVVVIWECETERIGTVRRKLSKMLEACGVGVGKTVDH